MTPAQRLKINTATQRTPRPSAIVVEQDAALTRPVLSSDEVALVFCNMSPEQRIDVVRPVQEHL